ncbi:DUF502 domain-containing protein [Halostella sp. JP-L12]|uniref:DUF502 domain-containing protein n=1 Tax=Halostella TaxID=1843185 RepID=UPI000EF7FB91|nr:MULTISPECIES: DUF502 domain-containing protein [Halostella]NHN46737.1 DUF502 domain-containing protein [Halostella sp. JP-L12]
MASWKRDFASGLVVLVPVLISAYVITWIYGLVASVTPQGIVSAELLRSFGIEGARTAELIRVIVTLSVFVVLVFAVGYLMRTAVGGFFEAAVDDLANRVPGLRVVYNASKMAAETALGGTEELQTPVKLEPVPGMRMTAFKTGRVTEDGREIIFLPTSPNITTGFVIEVDPENITETDERVEDALTRILSAGFGDSDREDRGIPIDVIEGAVNDDD